MAASKINPMTCTLAAILLMLGLHFLVPAAQLVPAPWTLLGILPLTIGAAMSTMAEQAFHRAGTTVQTCKASSALVTNGLYQITRNPMYLGLSLALGGVAVILGTLTPWAMVILFVLIVDRQFVVREEQMLAQRFGNDWQAYASRTRRWL